jgi:hypothetical protein
MTESQIAESTNDAVPAENGYTAVFYRADYARLALVLMVSRAVPGAYGTEVKSPAAQKVIDTMESAVAGVLAADAAMAGRKEGDKHYFDAEKFHEGTLLPVQRNPESAGADDEDDSEDDSDWLDDGDDDDEAPF